MPRQIEHIIVLMLENRSFDHLFGFLDHPKPYNGLTGTESNPISATDNTQKSVFKSTKTYITPDPPHSHQEILQQMDLGIGGTNDGFVAAFAAKKALNGGASDIGDIMASLDTESPNNNGFIMAQLAKRFVLCDNWFSSVPGETWPNRNFVHAATSAGEVNITKKFYKDKTVFEAVADHGLRWKIYHDGPPQSWVFYKLWFQGGFSHFSNFEEDVKKDRLANYVFIEPKHFSFGGNTNNMHPGSNKTSSDMDFKNAENLVAYIYNLLNTNKKVFNKSIFVITFDEHGGFYDHVPPGRCSPPDNRMGEGGFAFDKYGMRVPTIIISPYAKKSYVDSTLYDHTSIIKSVFENFGIPGQLTNRDKNANSFLDNALVSRKKNQLDGVREHDIQEVFTTRSGGPEELNDFQRDLVMVAEAVDKVMADNQKEVEANIKRIGNNAEFDGVRALDAHMDTNRLLVIEKRFLKMYP
ncbi:MAG: hypothetical protein H6567_05015 [Lewinellaceae bacterium]|nr:hypothetical protein [Lewinellaceae bacterium]